MPSVHSVEVGRPLFLTSIAMIQSKLISGSLPAILSPFPYNNLESQLPWLPAVRKMDPFHLRYRFNTSGFTHNTASPLGSLLSTFLIFSGPATRILTQPSSAIIFRRSNFADRFELIGTGNQSKVPCVIALPGIEVIASLIVRSSSTMLWMSN